MFGAWQALKSGAIITVDVFVFESFRNYLVGLF